MNINRVTVTAVTPDGYPVAIEFTLEEKERITEATDKLTKTLNAAGWEPMQPAQQAGNVGEIEFRVQKFTVTIQNGKEYYKVIGANYQKFGVTVWPEVLEEAKIAPEEIDPRNGMQPEPGLFAICTVKANGQPKKVVRLEQRDPDDY